MLSVEKLAQKYICDCVTCGLIKFGHESCMYVLILESDHSCGTTQAVRFMLMLKELAHNNWL